MKQIIEGGHFYSSEGFSNESEKGWSITQDLATINGNQSMLFIDDVHEKSFTKNPLIIPVKIILSDLTTSISEECMELLKIINQNNNVQVDQAQVEVSPNHIILESQMQDQSINVLNLLGELSGKMKAKYKNGKGYYSGSVKLTHEDNTPSCALFDTGLTLHKKQIGFDGAINVLPEIYKSQQEQVNKIFKLIDSNFKLSQHYFKI